MRGLGMELIPGKSGWLWHLLFSCRVKVHIYLISSFLLSFSLCCYSLHLFIVLEGNDIFVIRALKFVEI
jgi:hypothetical protein